MARRPVKATHECAVHEKSTHYMVCNLSSSGRQVEEYEGFRAQIRDIFKLLPSASFVLTYSDSDADSISITKFEDLWAAVGPMRQQLHIPLLVKVVHKCSSPTVRVVHGDSFCLLTPKTRPEDTWMGRPKFGRELPAHADRQRLNYEQFHCRVRDHFSVPSSTQFALIYRDPEMSEQYMTVATDEALEDAMEQAAPNNLRLDIRIIDEAHGSSQIIKNSLYIVKASHSGILCRLTVARGKLEFSFEEFRSRIRALFNLPASAQFMLSYIDEDQENITMMADNDLEDAILLQSLHPLKVNVTIIEGGSDINVTPISGHKQENNAI